MTIVELISFIGNDEVEVQSLNASMKGAEMRKDHTEITFGSSVTVNELLEGEKVGLVIWVPKAKFEEAKAHFANAPGKTE